MSFSSKHSRLCFRFGLQPAGGLSGGIERNEVLEAIIQGVDPERLKAVFGSVDNAPDASAIAEAIDARGLERRQVEQIENNLAILRQSISAEKQERVDSYLAVIRRHLSQPENPLANVAQNPVAAAAAVVENPQAAMEEANVAAKVGLGAVVGLFFKSFQKGGLGTADKALLKELSEKEGLIGWIVGFLFSDDIEEMEKEEKEQEGPSTPEESDSVGEVVAERSDFANTVSSIGILRYYGDLLEDEGDIFNPQSQKLLRDMMGDMSARDIGIGRVLDEGFESVIDEIYGQRSENDERAMKRKELLGFLRKVIQEKEVALRERYALVRQSAKANEYPANFDNLTVEQVYDLLGLGALNNAGDVLKVAFSGVGSLPGALIDLYKKGSELPAEEFAVLLSRVPASERSLVSQERLFKLFYLDHHLDEVGNAISVECPNANETEKQLVRDVVSEVEQYEDITEGTLMYDACGGDSDVIEGVQGVWDRITMRDAFQLYYLHQKQNPIMLRMKVLHILSKNDVREYTEASTQLLTASALDATWEGGKAALGFEVPPHMRRTVDMMQREAWHQGGKTVDYALGLSDTTVGKGLIGVGAWKTYRWLSRGGFLSAADAMSDVDKAAKLRELARGSYYSFSKGLSQIFKGDVGGGLHHLWKKISFGNFREARQMTRAFESAGSVVDDAARVGANTSRAAGLGSGLRSTASQAGSRVSNLGKGLRGVSKVGKLGHALGIAGVAMEAVDVASYWNTERPKLVAAMEAETDPFKKDVLHSKLKSKDKYVHLTAAASAGYWSPWGAGIYLGAHASEQISDSVYEGAEYMLKDASDFKGAPAADMLEAVALSQDGDVSFGQSLSSLGMGETFDSANENARDEAYRAYFENAGASIRDKEQRSAYVRAGVDYIRNIVSKNLRLASPTVLREATMYAYSYSEAHIKYMKYGEEMPNVFRGNWTERTAFARQTMETQYGGVVKEIRVCPDSVSCADFVALQLLEDLEPALAQTEAMVRTADLSGWDTMFGAVWGNEEDYRDYVRLAVADNLLKNIGATAQRLAMKKDSLTAADYLAAVQRLEQGMPQTEQALVALEDKGEALADDGVTVADSSSLLSVQGMSRLMAA